MNDKKEGNVTLATSFSTDDVALFTLSEMMNELKSKNRYFLIERSHRLLEKIVKHAKDHKNHKLAKGEKMYRARINEREMGNNCYPIGKMGAPPGHQAKHGRLNPVGISYLYLASNKNTAIAEVRPWKGCAVSVAEFDLNEEIVLVNFLNKEGVNTPRDGREDDIETTWFKIIPLLFSMPFDPRDDTAYIPIQYISERIKMEGFDGIMYDSALNNDGYNICLFNPQKALAEKTFLASVTAISHTIEIKEEKTTECSLFMRLAIDTAMEGVKKGQSPFGACITRGDEVISCAHNVVWDSMDITAHAEVHAIRDACKKLNTVDLSGCVIYSTCEPCPMCFSACHWAKISKIVCGARIEDAKQLGFNELTVSNKEMKQSGGSSIEIVEGYLRDEALELFKRWQEQENARPY